MKTTEDYLNDFVKTESQPEAEPVITQSMVDVLKSKLIIELFKTKIDISHI